jgi:exodeoxyribonuclease VII small subunit
VTGKKFEEALRRLEEVVRRLENGDIPLEEALDLFSEGVELARYCHGILDQAEQHLQVLAGLETLRNDGRRGDGAS